MEKNYETLYLCGKFEKVIGRRYNIRPDLDEGIEPEVKGYVYKETMAGFFRAWKLNEIHLGLTSLVNEMQVAEKKQIIKKTGLDESECLKIIETCVIMGLLYENRILFKDEDEIHLYMVDTGGIFAFEEAGIQYKKLAYTTNIEQRLKMYRKNIFLVENNMAEKEAVNIHFFEDTPGMPDNEKHNGTILLVDMEIAEKLGIQKLIDDELKRIVNNHKAKIYDLATKKYLDK
ncbi:MAG: hypothetical protein FH756_00510 [Firmicutes bacterium]|nr:hypothetical protein [Bacillota bacterium]